ncbi:hypothetical protein LZK98_08445 [Sphingomonas cannabina]|uniref:hypothetical protein n=1 Tax=Sphingomonas cannabina TaxID=2899123 RepID=UPI001F300099|nr:hypothetical protein [Sphingomonas cannabina]UIJ46956.1 hypothetical protein LZK98_08445 [Sphingomonas cannabina]
MTDRYDGKPFLRLLDSYVLDAIGFLDAGGEAAARDAEAAVRDTYGLSGGWREMVASEMKFPDGMPGALREMWTSGRKRFIETEGHEPDPGEFVRTFVDTNFAR